MEAHVICNNDSVEFVFIGPLEEAEKKRAELKEKDFQRYIWAYGKPCGEEVVRLAHDQSCYWHIHTVEAFDATK